MSLLKLPNEMLKEILKYTQPADLAVLAHSCRFLYKLWRDDLLAHTYGTVEVAGPEGIATHSANSCSRLLRTMKHFPTLPEYPTHRVVDWQGYCWCPPIAQDVDCDCSSKEEYLLEGVAFEALMTQLRKVQRIIFKGTLAPVIETVVSNLARKSCKEISHSSQPFRN